MSTQANSPSDVHVHVVRVKVRASVTGDDWRMWCNKVVEFWNGEACRVDREVVGIVPEVDLCSTTRQIFFTVPGPRALERLRELYESPPMVAFNSQLHHPFSDCTNSGDRRLTIAVGEFVRCSALLDDDDALKEKTTRARLGVVEAIRGKTTDSERAEAIVSRVINEPNSSLTELTMLGRRAAVCGAAAAAAAATKTVETGSEGDVGETLNDVELDDASTVTIESGNSSASELATMELTERQPGKSGRSGRQTKRDLSNDCPLKTITNVSSSTNTAPISSVFKTRRRSRPVLGRKTPIKELSDGDEENTEY